MKWFYEKETQVMPSSVTAFGIKLISRYGKAYEMIEMLNFAFKLAEMGEESRVREVFYDSKACLCNFEFNNVIEFSIEWVLIGEIAAKTISQYAWSDGVEHGVERLQYNPSK